ncbi:MAG: phosphomannomutase/phosphoglucomutase [candidate division KSB1 bacterium]|nr:phosphomannomutase/phosphoglucomutase [candidate division KSB1 bacterium]MDZ7302518.1 phosphomannomutase/phosphoglucomutase [candidate division KSB1 bacterium]MDZ7311887.1 phosphomannomutase/phosphoglucomutase [candidate division KSB1 bacterium]
MTVYQEIPENTETYVREPLIKDTGFREYDVRWLFGKELNEQGALTLGKAFGTLLKKNYPDRKEVVIGQDYRKYSQAVKHAFALGLVSSGLKVYDIGLCISPTLYFAQYHLKIKAGAMITASHNDNGWTGIKLAYDFSRTFGPSEIKSFKEIIHRGEYTSGQGNYEQVPDIDAAYIDDLVKGVKVQKPLKIVVCTGNGAAGLYTSKALRKAGHEVIEHLTELNWDYPNFNPNPENIKFLESIGKRVRKEKADLGIGIDGDGDRLGVVDQQGHEVYSDKVGLLIAQYLVQNHSDAIFVVDVKSTALFDTLIIKKGLGKVIYWKTGHSYIKEKVLDDKALAGFERSGHFFFNTPIGRGYDDANKAALMLCELISARGQSLDEILTQLPKTYQSPNMQPRCPDTVKYKIVEQLQSAYQEAFEKKMPIKDHQILDIITVNGIRVVFDDGSWFLVRASSNVPALVVLGESFSTKKRLSTMMKEVVDRLRTYKEVGEFDQMMDFND